MEDALEGIKKKKKKTRIKGVSSNKKLFEQGYLCQRGEYSEGV